MTFDKYVAQWDALCKQIDELQRKLKPLKEAEMAMRKSMAESVEEALGDRWREGVNKYNLSDGRVLKVTHTVKREVDMTGVEQARQEYSQLNDVPCTFDELFRVKLELDKKQWNTLGPAARGAVSHAITAKPQAPTVALT